MRNLIIFSWELCISSWLQLRLEKLSSEIQTPTGSWHLTRALAPVSWTRASSPAVHWLLHAGSRTVDPRHGDLLTGSTNTSSKLTKMAQKPSQLPLRKIKVKFQIKSCIFWGLTQWWSLLPTCLMSRTVMVTAVKKGTGEGLGKRQEELIPFLAVLMDKSDKRKLSYKVHFYRNI